jgi:hypothetical protein
MESEVSFSETIVAQGFDRFLLKDNVSINNE